MKATKELCGEKIPKAVWLLQLELAKFRIGLIKAELKKELNNPFDARNLHKEVAFVKAISFWESLSNEAKEELKGERYENTN